MIDQEDTAAANNDEAKPRAARRVARPWIGAQGGLVDGRVSRPVPHWAGSLAAWARPEPRAERETSEAGPVSAVWSGGRR